MQRFIFFEVLCFGTILCLSGCENPGKSVDIGPQPPKVASKSKDTADDLVEICNSRDITTHERALANSRDYFSSVKSCPVPLSRVEFEQYNPLSEDSRNPTVKARERAGIFFRN